MSKESKAVDTGVDVQVMSYPAGGAPITVPSASQVGNGVVVMPLPQAPSLSPLQAAPGAPTVIVITVGPKEKEKKEKKSSSVFQRL